MTRLWEVSVNIRTLLMNKGKNKKEFVSIFFPIIWSRSDSVVVCFLTWCDYFGKKKKKWRKGENVKVRKAVIIIRINGGWRRGEKREGAWQVGITEQLLVSPCNNSRTRSRSWCKQSEFDWVVKQNSKNQSNELSVVADIYTLYIQQQGTKSVGFLRNNQLARTRASGVMVFTSLLFSSLPRSFNSNNNIRPRLLTKFDVVTNNRNPDPWGIVQIRRCYTSIGNAKEMVVKVKRQTVEACMTCPLCNKLLKDATTISLCLHTCSSLDLPFFFSCFCICISHIAIPDCVVPRSVRFDSIRFGFSPDFGVSVLLYYASSLSDSPRRTNAAFLSYYS